MKHISRLIPYLIMWFLWAERNRCRHEDSQFKPYNVVWQVQMFIRNGITTGSIKPKHWKKVKMKIIILTQAEIRHRQPRVMQIKWKPPDHPWIKLNTDGSYNETSNKAGGGGVIRDHTGRLLLAFTTPLDAHSALEAELLAMHHGLMIAKEFGRPIWIESDAAQAIKLIIGTCRGPAHVRRAMALMIIYKSQNSLRATFIHREGNTAADFLAKLGAEKEAPHRMTNAMAPRILKAIVRMEALGIPNIRTWDDDLD